MNTLDLTVYFNEKDTTLTENQVERIQQALMFLKDKIFWNIEFEGLDVFDLKSTLKELGQEGLRHQLDGLFNHGIYTPFERGYLESFVEDWVNNNESISLSALVMIAKEIGDLAIYDYTRIPIHDIEKLKQWVKENDVDSNPQAEAIMNLKNIIAFLALSCVQTSLEEKQDVFKQARENIMKSIEGDAKFIKQAEIQLKVEQVSYPFTLLSTIGGIFNAVTMEDTSVDEHRQYWKVISSFLTRLVEHEPHEEAKSFYTELIKLLDAGLNLHQVDTLNQMESKYLN